MHLLKVPKEYGVTGECILEVALTNYIEQARKDLVASTSPDEKVSITYNLEIAGKMLADVC